MTRFSHLDAKNRPNSGLLSHFSRNGVHFLSLLYCIYVYVYAEIWLGEPPGRVLRFDSAAITATADRDDVDLFLY